MTSPLSSVARMSCALRTAILELLMEHISSFLRFLRTNSLMMKVKISLPITPQSYAKENQCIDITAVAVLFATVKFCFFLGGFNSSWSVVCSCELWNLFLICAFLFSSLTFSRLVSFVRSDPDFVDATLDTYHCPWNTILLWLFITLNCLFKPQPSLI